MVYTMKNFKKVFEEGNAVLLTLFLSVHKEASQVNASEKVGGNLVTQNASESSIMKC